MESHGLKHRLIGQVFDTNQYGKVVVLNYYNNTHVVVEFINSGTLCSVRLNNLKKGEVADAFMNRDSLIYGVGYSGYGKYRKSNHKEAYDAWCNMLRRCYSRTSHICSKTQSYVDCRVCKQWHNFQNFATWFYSQNRKPNYVLDKDIIKKGNKLYAPENCSLIPERINKLFERSLRHRGQQPIGVSKMKGRSKPYLAYSNDSNGERVYLGYYASAFEAFQAYKAYKESLIRKVATEYRNQLNPRVYDAMMKYEVEITD